MDTITIIFPEVKIEISISDLTFDTLEKLIFEIMQNIAGQVFAQAITIIDTYLRQNRRKGELVNTGKRKKSFLTRFGEVSISRTRYRDKTGKARYLLDETLSTMKNQRLSLSRAMIECFLATLSSYREVVRQAELFLGYSRSHESIRKSVLTEAKLLIEQENKRLQQIENLELPIKEAAPICYAEADSTMIKLQKPEKEKKLEVKIGIGYHGKENRYHSGPSQRLREKFVYLGTGQDFMYQFSLKAEEEMALSQSQKLYFGGDGDTWITSGLRDYFPNATYLLCRFHLNKHLRESLARRKPEQKLIKDLLLSNQIEKALERINSLLLHPYDRKEKEQLEKLSSYLSHNREGITNQVTLKDKEIVKTGAIESNVNVAIATRFKKQGRSWSKRGALSLLKVKETILNGRWDTWWQKERYHPLQVKPFKPPLPASYFTKEASSSPVIQVRIPALEGPHQGRPWVGVLRKLSEVDLGN